MAGAAACSTERMAGAAACSTERMAGAAACSTERMAGAAACSTEVWLAQLHAADLLQLCCACLRLQLPQILAEGVLGGCRMAGGLVCLALSHVLIAEATAALPREVCVRSSLACVACELGAAAHVAAAGGPEQFRTAVLSSGRSHLFLNKCLRPYEDRAAAILGAQSAAEQPLLQPYLHAGPDQAFLRLPPHVAFIQEQLHNLQWWQCPNLLPH
jgi:hypothetical protein